MAQAWQSFWQIVKDNKEMNWRATIIFIMSIVVGLFINISNPLMLEMLEQMSELAGQLGADSSAFDMILLIFMNNITVALLMIFLGFIFGIVPFLFLVINGLFLGFFTKFFLSEGSSVFGYFVSLLPHGVLELTAIVLAGAYGFKLGAILWRNLKAFVTGNEAVKDSSSFADIARDTVIFIVGIMIILLLAAIIESTISLALAGMFI